MGPRLTLAVGALAAVLVAVGWFLLSSKVAHSDVRTAASESVGAILVLMVIASLIGSIGRRRDTDE